MSNDVERVDVSRPNPRKITRHNEESGCSQACKLHARQRVVYGGVVLYSVKVEKFKREKAERERVESWPHLHMPNNHTQFSKLDWNILYFTSPCLILHRPFLHPKRCRSRRSGQAWRNQYMHGLVCRRRKTHSHYHVHLTSKSYPARSCFLTIQTQPNRERAKQRPTPKY